VQVRHRRFVRGAEAFGDIRADLEGGTLREAAWRANLNGLAGLDEVSASDFFHLFEDSFDLSAVGEEMTHRLVGEQLVDVIEVPADAAVSRELRVGGEASSLCVNAHQLL
jgi:hypothetical protein